MSSDANEDKVFTISQTLAITEFTCTNESLCINPCQIQEEDYADPSYFSCQNTKSHDIIIKCLI